MAPDNIESNPIQTSEVLESNPSPIPEKVESFPIPQPPPVLPKLPEFNAPDYNASDLYIHLQKTKEEPKHPAHAFNDSLKSCCGSVFFTVGLGFSLALPIVKQINIVNE